MNNNQLILNDEKQLADYGIFNEGDDTGGVKEYGLSLNVANQEILIRLNLSHTLKKYGSFMQKVDTSGGSASFHKNEELEIRTTPLCSVYCLKFII